MFAACSTIEAYEARNVLKFSAIFFGNCSMIFLFYDDYPVCQNHKAISCKHTSISCVLVGLVQELVRRV